MSINSPVFLKSWRGFLLFPLPSKKEAKKEKKNQKHNVKKSAEIKDGIRYEKYLLGIVGTLVLKA